MERRAGALVALAIAAGVTLAAQSGGKPVSGGNPTPGTTQPDPPNLSDRVTVTGCLQSAPRSAANSQAADANTPSDARFVLSNAKKVDRVPPGTGGSPLAAGANSASYRLEGLESQFSPFVNASVEVSGEIKPPASDKPAASNPPTLLVEFIQKVAATCR